VVEEIERQRDQLVQLAADLIAFDTTAREPGRPARDEASLQEYLAGRLGGVGAKAEVWEPNPQELAGDRLVPPGTTFAGWPQMLARFPGRGGGRSLLLNGHIDVVSSQPRERWTSDPNRAELREGKLYGRGACDMKGGVAAMVLAAEVLARLNIRLDGDLLVCTVTDEETTGAGAAAAIAHGARADAGIVTEPSSFDVWTACRGSLIPSITVEGRPGHAGLPQPHWSEGGAVNAIQKMSVVMDALQRLQEEWRLRPDQRHPRLSPGDIVATKISGGEWVVTYPASCRVTYHVEYLPAQADAEGWGSAVQQEIVECIHRAARADPWLAEHPPRIGWEAGEVPSAEVPDEHPIVQVMLGACAAVGLPGRAAGFDNWHDGATFTRIGGTPSIAFGPRAAQRAHTIDEHVPVDDLVSCAQAIAVAAIRFCRGAEGDD
jgi:acetylornithine deacetylase